jgi:hypothetical protein
MGHWMRPRRSLLPPPESVLSRAESKDEIAKALLHASKAPKTGMISAMDSIAHCQVLLGRACAARACIASRGSR